jgi:hypothetical protein
VLKSKKTLLQDLLVLFHANWFPLPRHNSWRPVCILVIWCAQSPHTTLSSISKLHFPYHIPKSSLFSRSHGTTVFQMTYISDCPQLPTWSADSPRQRGLAPNPGLNLSAEVTLVMRRWGRVRRGGKRTLYLRDGALRRSIKNQHNTYNPSYLGDQDWEDHSLRPTKANNLWGPQISKITSKMDWRCRVSALQAAKCQSHKKI